MRRGAGSAERGPVRTAFLLVAQLAACLAAHFAVPTGRIAAQQPAAVAPGMRVRVAVSQPGSPRYIGTLDTLTPDTLALRVENRLARAPVAIPVASIRSLEVSRARGECGGRRLSCVVIGGLVGVAAGTAAAFAIGRGPGEIAFAAGLVTVPVGFFAGIGIGGTIGGDRWERVPLRVQSRR